MVPALGGGLERIVVPMDQEADQVMIYAGWVISENMDNGEIENIVQVIEDIPERDRAHVIPSVRELIREGMSGYQIGALLVGMSDVFNFLRAQVIFNVGPLIDRDTNGNALIEIIQRVSKDLLRQNMRHGERAGARLHPHQVRRVGLRINGRRGGD